MSGTNTISPLRQRMIEDMAARKLDPHTQRSHISSVPTLTLVVLWRLFRGCRRPGRSR